MTNDSELTPLMQAARNLDEETCIELLQNPLTNPNIQDSEGKTALMHLLASTIYQPNPNREIELTETNRKKDVSLQKIAAAFLQHPQTDITLADKDGNTAFMFASRYKDYNICLDMLTRFDIDIHTANHKGENYWNADLGNYLLINSINQGKDKVLDQIFQEKEININCRSFRRKKTPLMTAEMKDNQHAIDLLLARKEIDVNAQNSFGETVLSHAIKSNHLDTVMKLAERSDLDYSLKDVYGKGLEQNVIESNNPAIFIALKDEPLNYDSDSTKGAPLLIQALLDRKLEVARPLVEYQMCDVNIRDEKTGDTPLLIASRFNDGPICRGLMAAGADVNAVNKEGHCPLTEAVLVAAKGQYVNTDCLSSLLKSPDLNYDSCNQAAEMISGISAQMKIMPPARMLSTLEMKRVRLRKLEQKRQPPAPQRQETTKPKRPRIGQKVAVYSTIVAKKQKED